MYAELWGEPQLEEEQYLKLLYLDFGNMDLTAKIVKASMNGLMTIFGMATNTHLNICKEWS